MTKFAVQLFQTCPLYSAKSIKMNTIDKLLIKDINKSVYNFGMSNLHTIYLLKNDFKNRYVIPFLRNNEKAQKKDPRRKSFRKSSEYSL